MHFPLDVKKVVQAVGVLFREDRVSNMNYMRLLKILYVSDRESLKETGRPIAGGPVVAMERGPVLEEVYNLIRGQHREMPAWNPYLRRNRFCLELLQDPDVGMLSRFEIRKLQEVSRRHAEDDEWDMVNLMHKLPEWLKNNPGTSSRPICLRDMMEALGIEADAGNIEEEAEELNSLRRLLRR